jgi:hypothetical protein
MGRGVDGKSCEGCRENEILDGRRQTTAVEVAG